MASIPTEEEVLGFLDSLSNWSRWGADDERGTLNFVTAEKVRESGSCIRTGRSISLSRDIETSYGHPDNNAQLFFVSTGQGVVPVQGVPPTAFGFGAVAAAVEYFGLVYHGNFVTHVDALSHLFWEGRLYNGHPAGAVTSEFGATRLAVTAMGNGVVTRGVLLDVPRAQGRPHLDAGEAVTPDQLEEAAAAQGIEVRSGDALFLRTGRWAMGHGEGTAVDLSNLSEEEQRREALTGHVAGSSPGWHAACMPWVHEREVALLGADVPQEVTPPLYSTITGPVHTLALVAMGMPLIDNCDFEELSNACAELGQWDFQFVMAPLRIKGGTGSPVNPVAVL